MSAALRLHTALPLAAMALVVAAVVILRQPSRNASSVSGEAATYSAHDNDDEVAALAAAEKLATNNAPDTLRQFIQMADLVQDNDKRIDGLTRLKADGAAGYSEYLTLVELLAVQGDFATAFAVMQDASQRFPEAAGDDFITFYAALALDAGQADAALPFVRRVWNETKSDTVLEAMKSLSDTVRARGA